MLKKARQSSLVADVAAQLENAILDGDYHPGDRLPPSKELEAVFGTSRGTLREAFRILEHKQLIESRVGVKGGVFVRRSTTEPVSDGLALLIRQRRISFSDLSGFRMLVEPEMLRLVADRADEADISELLSFIPRLRACADKGGAGWRELIRLELVIRKTLLRIAGSTIIQAVLMPIYDNILVYSDRDEYCDEEWVRVADGNWRKVLENLARREAGEAVRVHLANVGHFQPLIDGHATGQGGSGRVTTEA